MIEGGKRAKPEPIENCGNSCMIVHQMVEGKSTTQVTRTTKVTS
jgi:hypothetical protein